VKKNFTQVWVCSSLGLFFVGWDVKKLLCILLIVLNGNEPGGRVRKKMNGCCVCGFEK
jgi:hypothetical protein